ncbi:MAG: PAS domain S-box protein, partial [Pseudomonadota bacterium]
MNKLIAAFFQQTSFRRQLAITIGLGILFLALSSSLTGSWQVNERVRADLIEQGQRITENLARQSALALIFDSVENADEAVKATMAFPGVIGVEIRHSNGTALLARGNNTIVKVPGEDLSVSGLQAAAMMDAESEAAWHFAAPVYSQPVDDSPFGDASTPELLGHVSVVMSKSALARMTSDIFITNLVTSFSFAILLLFLIRFMTRNMARPLDQLAASMERAQNGESQVRAEPGGPKDIAKMAHAFNDMMAVQEEREAALRIAAIAFETEEGMMVTDGNARIIRVNQAFTRITGYSVEEALGQSPAMLKSERQDDAFYQRMWQSLRENNSWQGEIWDRRKNGEVYPEWLTITAVMGKNGKVTNYVGTFVDFTDRKKAEE